MKKLIILIFATGCLMSCKREYDDIDFKESDGIVLEIDSSKYEKALIYDRGKELVVVTKDGIKEVVIWDTAGTVMLSWWIGVVFCFLIVVFTDRD